MSSSRILGSWHVMIVYTDAISLIGVPAGRALSKNLIDDVQYYQPVCGLRWPNSVSCPLSNENIAYELSHNESDTYQMTTHLYDGIVKKSR